MKELQIRTHFLLAEIILLLVEVIQLLWFGKVILMKMNKNLLKILVLKLEKHSNNPQLHQEDHQKNLLLEDLD